MAHRLTPIVQRSFFKTFSVCGQFGDLPKPKHFAFSRSRHLHSKQGDCISTDLRRFLEEVGTDPKEARYWLRQFQQQATDPDIPFAVLQIKSCLLQDSDLIESLCSSISFLHRNGMRTVLVYGPNPNEEQNVVTTREKLCKIEMKLLDCLEKYYGKIRTFCGSSGIIYSESNDHSRTPSNVEHVNVEPIKWALRSGHIPILKSLSIDHTTGMLTPLCPQEVAIKLSEALKPFKIIFLNESGGLVDDSGKMVSHVKVPADIPAILQIPKEEPHTKQIGNICNLFQILPGISSAVITSPHNILKELFTYQGSGTIFQKTETIHSYKSLKNVDVPRLEKLISQSFKRPLISDYIKVVEKYIRSIYISESYSAAAIVIRDGENCEVPYLDKFVISSKSQGQGTSEALWDLLKQDFQCLYWRSRRTNRINPWYFIRADGSWTVGDWTIFWYGVDEPKLSHSLVERAVSLPESFDPIARHDETRKLKNKSTTGYFEYI